MPNGVIRIPKPVNEPVRAYAPGSPEKKSIKKRLSEMLGETIEIPLIIGGKEVRTGKTAAAVCPFDHGHVLATYHQAGAKEVEQAIAASREAWATWSEMRWEDRAAVFLKAADLLAGPWRDTLNAATMLNQAKTVHQAEIDSACELIDFYRFNPHYMQFVYEQQPESAPQTWNYVEYRALEGFVFAVTPFNFTSIAGNLPTAPAMMGNVVLWKPASSAILSAYYIMRLLEEAGLPPGVINFIPGRAAEVGDAAFDSREFAGVHFTGSTAVFQGMWKKVGNNIAKYAGYPRIVGETGGKDFIFAHPSADVPALVTGIVRGAFEYQGQKCSAASRAFIPRSLWNEVRDGIAAQLAEIRMGSPMDFRNFVSAVIDAKAFGSIREYIDYAKNSNDAKILFGGKTDDSKGYFIEPTIIEAARPDFRLMCEEIFGPVLTLYVYDDAKIDDALTALDQASPYGLTGAIFAQDRHAIVKLAARLRHSAGNFYINDKPTGAVVGQQPFGGSRASGTNDKAGSFLNLVRWASMRSIKETFVPPKHFAYPFLGEE
ncbi:MAG: L-glutamate gamma-semialdehyde dehydrogenase [Thermoanaerobaculia bacterium]